VVSRRGSKNAIGRSRCPALSSSSKSPFRSARWLGEYFVFTPHARVTHQSPSAPKSMKTSAPINAMPARQARRAHSPADDAAGPIKARVEEFWQAKFQRMNGLMQFAKKSRRQDYSRLRRYVPDRRLCLSVSQHPRSAVHLGGRLHDRALSAGNLGLRFGVTVRAPCTTDMRGMGAALVTLPGRAILRAHRAKMDHRENLWR
jgi:hypothetical protein